MQGYGSVQTEDPLVGIERLKATYSIDGNLGFILGSAVDLTEPNYGFLFSDSKKVIAVTKTPTLVTVLPDVIPLVDKAGNMFQALSARIDALTKRVSSLENQVTPDFPMPRPGNTLVYEGTPLVWAGITFAYTAADSSMTITMAADGTNYYNGPNFTLQEAYDAREAGTPSGVLRDLKLARPPCALQNYLILERNGLAVRLMVGLQTSVGIITVSEP
jgi:hypothetical protein